MHPADPPQPNQPGDGPAPAPIVPHAPSLPHAPQAGAAAPPPAPLAAPPAWAQPGPDPTQVPMPVESYGQPEPPLDNVQRRAPAALIAVVGLVALVGAAGLLFRLGGDRAGSGGAETPEAAVQQMFDSMSDKDIAGMVEIAHPDEVEPFLRLGRAYLEEFADLGESSTTLPESGDVLTEAGIDWQLDSVDLDYRVDQYSERVAKVSVVGGTTTMTMTADELPFELGDMDLSAGTYSEDPGVTVQWERLSDTSITGSLTLDFAELDLAEPVYMMSVKRADRWFLSPMYSAGELARTQSGAGLAAPDWNGVLSANGQETPEAVLETFMDRLEQADMEGVLDLLPPGQLGLAYDFRPMMLEDYNPQDLADVQLEVEELSLRTEAIDDDLTRVFIDRAVMTGVDISSGERETVVWDGDCLRSTAQYEEPQCLSDLSDQRVAGLFVVVRREQGLWYMSPLDTTVQYLIDFAPSFRTEIEDLTEGQLGTDDWLNDPWALIEDELENELGA